MKRSTLVVMSLVMSMAATALHLGNNLPKKPVKLTNHEVNGLHYLGQGLNENRQRVVIIDTGVHLGWLNTDYMCNDVAQISLEHNQLPYHSHGTTITSIIAKDMDTRNYCITMIRTKLIGRNIIGNIYKSLRVAETLDNMIAINMSVQRVGYLHHEYASIKRLLKHNPGLTLAVAAGNDSIDLDSTCIVYPACYAKLIGRERV